MTIKNVTIQGISSSDLENVEMKILHCFSVPKYNEQMYKRSLQTLVLSFTWWNQPPLTSTEEMQLLSFFSNLTLLRTLKIENKGMQSLAMSSESVLDKILSKYLLQAGCQNISSVCISKCASMPKTAYRYLSDGAAKQFFEQILASQQEITEIALPDLGLRSDSISTLLYKVILRAPDQAGYAPVATDGEQSQFQGCFKTLRVLNLQGNFLDQSQLDAKTFYSIFDFLENIEELNICRLKFQSFKTFKQQFLVDFVCNQDYKPYMNTLKRVNLNLGSEYFYAEGAPKMSYSSAKKVLDQF